jgi:hypothetical protein
MKFDYPRKLTGAIAAALLLTMVSAGCRQGSADGGSKPSEPTAVGQPLTNDQTTVVDKAIGLMASTGLSSDSMLGIDLMNKHIIKAATPDDVYMKGSEKAGDTPYAYTLSDGKQPSTIVLAPRFFTEATDIGRAALLVHEFGHYRAYVATGKSDEVDGYKVEYDKHKQLGLTEADGLVYFSMLDGVVEYVVPKYPKYKDFADVKAYNSQ